MSDPRVTGLSLSVPGRTPSPPVRKLRLVVPSDFWRRKPICDLGLCSFSFSAAPSAAFLACSDVYD